MEDDEVDGETYVIYDNHLVSLCCDTCVEEFEKEPKKFLAMAVKMAPKKASGGN